MARDSTAGENVISLFRNSATQQRKAEAEILPPLYGDGGGGTSGGVTDDWKSSVDRQLGQLHGDVRNLLYGLIAGFLILAAGGLALFDRQATRLSAIEQRQERLEGKLETQDARINGKLDLLLERKGGASAR